jgi:urease accessory protein
MAHSWDIITMTIKDVTQSIITPKLKVLSGGLSNSRTSDRLLYLLQVVNSAFPTGAFNHSYGFETLIDSGEIHDVHSFEKICKDWIRYSVVPGDAAAVAHAHRAILANDTAALISLDHMVAAIKLSVEVREASAKTGGAMASTVWEVFAPVGFEGYLNAIKNKECEGHHAVTFGAAAAAMKVSVFDAVLAFIQAALTNLASVASRLIPLGQVDTQRVIHGAWDNLEELVSKACDTPIDSIGTTTISLDIASMHHERLYSRLCMS